jgi:hypothetical protein
VLYEQVDLRVVPCLCGCCRAVLCCDAGHVPESVVIVQAT